MKVAYKWPLTSQNVQQNIMTNRKNNQTVSTSEQSTALGSVTIVFYFLTFILIYGTALYNQHKSGDSFLKLNTLSTSFEYSNKISTTVSIIIFMALIQGFFSSQNIYSNEPKKSSIIAFNYIVAMCWLLFMFIFPRRKDGTTSWAHSFLAFCVILSVIINCFLLTNLYSDYFDVEPLTTIVYIIFISGVISLISMIFNAATDKPLFKKFAFITHNLVAITELICIILYGVFLVIFTSQFPPLPDAQLSCKLVQTSTLSPSSSL